MRLRDLGVIAEATLRIGPGFTAITGETGAGKTMVVTGLGLLLGQRADSGAVRAGASHAAVDGIWLVEDSGAVADRVRDAGGELESMGDGRAELYVGRTLSAEGRSRATVGGRTAPAAVLADLADELVVVHGQSDQLRLRSATAQRRALDRFGGAAVDRPLSVYRAAFERRHAIDRELEALVMDRTERLREADALREMLSEIDAADPQPDEDEELTRRADRLAHVEDLRLAAATAHSALSSEDDGSDVGSLLAEVRRALERASSQDSSLNTLAEQAADLGYRAVDLAGALSSYLADLDEQGPHELAAVDERRAVLVGLIRRHGSLDAALDLRRDGPLRLAELDDDDDRIHRLTTEREAAASRLDAAALALTAARSAGARVLGADVTAELHALAMPDAVVSVAVSAGTESVDGRDDVSILLAPHPGAHARPVSRGASGGELSRVMLAIEVVIAATDPVPTFVFDEVDAGIGGAAAIEVGRRLAALSRSAQVIAVTHLAQVAAFADNHLSVVKTSDGVITASSVRALTGIEREYEMARLLSGLADSESAMTHARELLALGSGGQ